MSENIENEEVKKESKKEKSSFFKRMAIMAGLGVSIASGQVNAQETDQQKTPEADKNPKHKIENTTGHSKFNSVEDFNAYNKSLKERIEKDQELFNVPIKDLTKEQQKERSEALTRAPESRTYSPYPSSPDEINESTKETWYYDKNQEKEKTVTTNDYKERESHSQLWEASGPKDRRTIETQTQTLNYDKSGVVRSSEQSSVTQVTGIELGIGNTNRVDLSESSDKIRSNGTLKQSTDKNSSTEIKQNGDYVIKTTEKILNLRGTEVPKKEVTNSTTETARKKVAQERIDKIRGNGSVRKSNEQTTTTEANEEGKIVTTVQNTTSRFDKENNITRTKSSEKTNETSENNGIQSDGLSKAMQMFVDKKQNQ